jgi:hypothetical protein
MAFPSMPANGTHLDSSYFEKHGGAAPVKSGRIAFLEDEFTNRDLFGTVRGRCTKVQRHAPHRMPRNKTHLCRTEVFLGHRRAISVHYH